MTLTSEAYNDLIERTQQRVQNIITLPYYRIFGSEREQKKDLIQKLELMIWLVNRKYKRYGNCN